MARRASAQAAASTSARAARPLLLLVAAVSAIGLAACGEGSGTTASPAAPSVASTPATSSAPTASTPITTTPSTTATKTATTPTRTTPGAATTPALPSGSASSGSSGGAASFRTPTGDNSIPDFGAEATASERSRATVALAAFLRARAAGDWTTACSYLSATTRRQLETFTRSSKTKGCGPVLAALSNGPGGTRVTLTSGVAALRIKGKSAFALFHGPHNSKYVMPLLSEGGAWKIGQVAPIAYPLGSAAAAP